MWPACMGVGFISSLTYNIRLSRKEVIFLDSKSVLETIITLLHINNSNYLISLIKSKIYQLKTENVDLKLVWIPSHKDIPGNELVDLLA